MLPGQSERTLVVQSGHASDIYALQFSPDGKTIGTASKDGTIRLWDVRTTKEFYSFTATNPDKTEENALYFQCVAFSPDGNTVFGGATGSGYWLCAWDMKSFALKYQVEVDDDPDRIAISPDGKLMAITLDHGTELRRVEDGSLIKLIEYKYPDAYNEYALFSTDNRKLLVGTRARIMVVDPATGNTVDTLCLGDASFGMFWADNGTTLVLPDPKKDDIACISWPDGTPKRRISMEDIIFDSSTRFAVSDQKKEILILSDERTYRLDANTGNRIQQFNVRDQLYEGVYLSPDANSMACFNKAGWYLWNLKTVTEIGAFSGLKNDVSSLSFSGADEFLGIGRYWNPMQLLSLQNGISLHQAPDNTKRAQRIWFNPGNSFCLVERDGFHASLLDMLSDTIVVGFKQKEYPFSGYKYEMAIPLQGWKLVLAKDDYKGKELFPFGSGTPIREDIDLPVSAYVHYNPQENKLYWVANWDTDSLTVWRISVPDFNIEKRYSVGAETYTNMECVSASPDGKYVASGNYRFFLWDGKTGQLLHRLELPDDDHLSDIHDVCFSSDGKKVAYGDHNRNAWVLDPATGKVIWRLQGHTAPVMAVRFTRDNRILVTGGADSRVIFWDMASGKMLATFVSLSGEDFVITTPDGYYMTTLNGTRSVAFRVGTKVFPFEQFDLQYNRPDIVLKRLGFCPPTVIDAYYKAWQKRISRLGFTEASFSPDMNVPVVELRQEGLLPTISGKSVTVGFSATDQKYALDRIQVFVNDVPVYGAAGISLKGQGLKTVQRTLDLELLPGKNRIQISVLNEKGVESLKETYDVFSESPEEKPVLYLVTLGVSAYSDTRFNLNYAAKDALDLAAMLQKSGAYSSVRVKSLTDGQVTKASVLALKSFLAEARTQDVVLLFAAGHGVLDANLDYYFATSDLDFNNPSANGLPYAQLESLLDGIKALRKLLIMDTCHSGEVDKEEVQTEVNQNTSTGKVVFRSAGVGIRNTHFGLENSFQLMQSLFTDLRRGTGATVISSAGGAEYAMEGTQWKNGVFTFCMLNGLASKQADLNHDGSIMVSELRTYAGEEVKKLTSGQQQPTARVENLTLDFRIW